MAFTSFHIRYGPVIYTSESILACVCMCLCVYVCACVLSADYHVVCGLFIPADREAVHAERIHQSPDVTGRGKNSAGSVEYRLRLFKLLPHLRDVRRQDKRGGEAQFAKRNAFPPTRLCFCSLFPSSRHGLPLPPHADNLPPSISISAI